ncbi:hypothetical protein KJ636_02010 [Patescibacteria group bacterium]|nr:hypothetical protein [Patescibacteria group bacterium]MBU4481275.1 hypothetical protein [Patescibacteria group bacterium]
MIGVAISKNNVKIRLTTERWYHVSENHCELAGSAFQVLESIEAPDLIIKGLSGELLSLKEINKRYLVVIYRETNKDGFIITAFYTIHLKQLLRKRKIIWPKKH